MSGSFYTVVLEGCHSYDSHKVLWNRVLPYQLEGS